MKTPTDDEECGPGPLSVLTSSELGHPIHEWLVTYDDAFDDYWGGGYVVHTVDPCLVFRWGITDQVTNNKMSGGFGFDDGEYFLSVLLVNAVSRRKLDKDDIDQLIPGAVLAAVQKLHQLSAEE